MGFCLKIDGYNGVSDLQNMSSAKSFGSFISEVQQDLSIACSLPFTIPKKEIERIITLSAKWMYKNYEEAAEERYYIIPKEVFQTDNFKCDRTLILPKCVLTVHGIHEAGGALSQNTFDGTLDTSLHKFFMRDTLFSSSGLANGSDSLMYHVIASYWLDMVNHITTSPISFDYNANSNKLVILGRTPNTHIVVQLYKELEIEFLMNDEIFYRYVVAKCKQQLARILGTFAFNLPGGITINYDMIKDEGADEITKIEEEVRNEWGSDFFFMTRNI